MHSISEFGANVPAFLAKLWNMIEDSSTNDLIVWSPSGASFIIRDQARFCKELLPMYYKHNNMASFIRQLNMYGFHKIVSVEAGSTKLECDEHEFHHPCFIKDHPYMIEHIKRKITGSKIEGVAPKPDMVNKVLTDVRQMRNRQESMDSRLSQMKLENEALWRELAILRQKHLKQQQIVNKLIQFLVSLVQHPHNNGISVKRRTMPLMLQDKTGRRREFMEPDKKSEFMKSPSGPVIHELDPAEYATALLDTVESISEETPAFINEEPAGEEDSEKCDVSLNQVINDCVNDKCTAEELFLGSTPDVLECSNTSPSPALLINSKASANINPNRLRIASKRGHSKDKKRMKKDPICEIKQSPVNDIATITLPEISNDEFGGNIPVVVDSSSVLNHITSDSFSMPVELGTTTVNLDDLASMCPTVTDMLKNQSSQSESSNSVVSNVVNTKEPSKQNAARSIGSKNIVNKKYNKGKDASSLFKSNKRKFSKSLDPTKDDNSALAALGTVNEDLSSAFSEEDKTKSDSKTDLTNIVNEPVNNDMTIACTTGVPNQLSRYTGFEEKNKKIDDMDSHIDSMQTELESLKELLKNENLSLDANALLGLFNNDDPLGYSSLDIPLMPQESADVKENSSNKLAMYQTPGVLDLTDVFSGDWSLPETPTGTLPETAEDLTNDSELPVNIFSELNTPTNEELLQPSFPPAKKKRK